MDCQWILPIWPETPPSDAICSRPTGASAAQDEPHGRGKAISVLAQAMPGFASHHNHSPREKGRATQGRGPGRRATLSGGIKERIIRPHGRNGTRNPPLACRTAHGPRPLQLLPSPFWYLGMACLVSCLPPLPRFPNGAEDGQDSLRQASWPRRPPLLPTYLASNTRTTDMQGRRHAHSWTRRRWAYTWTHRWAHRWTHRWTHGFDTWLGNRRCHTQTQPRPSS